MAKIISDGRSSDESSDSDDYDDDHEERQRQYLVDRTLLNPSTSDGALGDWEKYTKGFGSKIMAKLGYIHGTGLGNNGEGIVAPIQIQVLPSGKSLDYCMELRERANGDKDLFSVDRKWKKQKQKQEQINARAYERDRRSDNVFNFLNDNVLASLGGAASEERTASPSTNQPNAKVLQGHSTKNLNVAAFKIGEDIKKLERDIQSVKNSIARQQRGTPAFNKLNGQLSLKNLELNKLKSSEKSVASEQTFRKDKSKMTVF